MTKITTFGRYEHAKVSTQVLAALKVLGDELGVDFSVNGGQIGTTSGRLNLTVKVRETANGQNAAQANFNLHCGGFNLPREAFGRTFVHNGRTFKVVGINPGAWKFPVSCERQPDGANYKFPADLVRSSLGLVAPNPAKRFA